jgi:L-ribulose-5-phosphate 3-epimerase
VHVFELGIISDEISDDLARACDRVRAWGMGHVELRTMWGKNVLQLSDDELARARRIVLEHGLRVSAIASPVFKSPLSGEAREVAADFALAGAERFEDQLALLERTFEVCDHFDTSLARVFSFWREPWDADLAVAVAEKLAVAAAAAKRAGKRLLVENEPVCTIGTGRQLGEFDAALRRVAGDHLDAIGLLWDPGNALAAGEERPYPDGYAALDPARIIHVHLKDVTRGADGAPRFVPLGRGAVDYRGQLGHLLRDGYAGLLMLEPHYRPSGVALEEAARTAFEAARTMVDEALTGPGPADPDAADPDAAAGAR